MRDKVMLSPNNYNPRIRNTIRAKSFITEPTYEFIEAKNNKNKKVKNKKQKP